MEFQRIPWSAVQRKFGLTERQMKYIKTKWKQWHKEDEWLVFRRNEYGKKVLWVYMEGVNWICEVYLKRDVPYILAEIDYAEKNINRLEQELNFHYNPVFAEQMNTNQMAVYFDRSPKTILNNLSYLRKENSNWIIDTNPYIVTKEGIEWLEKNVYTQKYLEDLLRYKRILQAKKKGKI